MITRRIRGDHPAAGLWAVLIDGEVVEVFASKARAVAWMKGNAR